MSVTGRPTAIICIATLLASCAGTLQRRPRLLDPAIGAGFGGGIGMSLATECTADDAGDCGTARTVGFVTAGAVIGAVGYWLLAREHAERPAPVEPVVAMLEPERAPKRPPRRTRWAVRFDLTSSLQGSSFRGDAATTGAGVMEACVRAKRDAYDRMGHICRANQRAGVVEHTLGASRWPS